MNKLNLAAIALCTGITFACSPKASMVKGVICDATINTLTVVSEEGDTLSFSTLDMCIRDSHPPVFQNVSYLDN